MTRPFLLLDVDGVLAPFGVRQVPAGFEWRDFGGHGVWLSADHGRWLRELTAWFDLVWATAWETDAADLIAPVLGLPKLPVIEFTSLHEAATWKLPDVTEFVGDRPLAWIDDDLHRDVDQWARMREAETLLIHTRSNIGMAEDHVETLREFGRRLVRT